MALTPGAGTNLSCRYRLESPTHLISDDGTINVLKHRDHDLIRFRPKFGMGLNQAMEDDDRLGI